ncbi:hypothetical protein EG829_19070 [bacterium]|nr:hypothetical protein [bacterium]
MAILRLPNPGSDFERFVAMFQTIYRAAQSAERATFDLDFMMDAVAGRSLVSSGGAVGAEALERSRRADRSRDPMYNQLKMYSELLRMLGWIHSEPDRRLDFRPTLLAESINAATVPLRPEYHRLLREMLLAITFPNPNTENRGIANHRPYMRTLQLMDRVGGRLTRDEAIIAIYSISDDRAVGVLDRAAEAVTSVRGDSRRLSAALVDFCVANGVQVNSAQNYTRMLVGALKSPVVDWCESFSNRADYERPIRSMRLTATGNSWARRASEYADVRWGDIAVYDQTSRSAFINLTFYAMFERCGFSLDEEGPLMRRAAEDCRRILDALEVDDYRRIIFSPVQEAPLADLSAAEAYAASVSG